MVRDEPWPPLLSLVGNSTDASMGRSLSRVSVDDVSQVERRKSPARSCSADDGCRRCSSCIQCHSSGAGGATDSCQFAY